MDKQNKQEKPIVEQMFQAGIHLGHRRRQRHPKMLPYIYTEKEDIQILDLLQTYWCIYKACSFLFDACSKGQSVLFVGTKKHFSKYIEQIAKDCESWYITQRWLGGLITNWQTMRRSIVRKSLQNLSKIQSKSKKETAQIQRKQARFEKFLGGVKKMDKIPDIVIILDQQNEMNAVRECLKYQKDQHRKLAAQLAQQAQLASRGSKLASRGSKAPPSLTLLTLLDTNGDPRLTDLFIPSNDDSLSSLQFILKRLSRAIKEGRLASRSKIQKKVKHYSKNLRRRKHKSSKGSSPLVSKKFY